MSVCDIKLWEGRSGSDVTAGADRLGAAEVIGGTCHENWGAHGPVRRPSAEEEVLEGCVNGMNGRQPQVSRTMPMVLESRPSRRQGSEPDDCIGR